MHLTREEERAYNGEYGWANQTCMKILARLGDLFNAEKLIPIGSAHISGVSYKTLGDAPIEFLKALADSGGKVKVKTTLNPHSFDSEYLFKKLPSRLVKKQQNILKQFDRMGLTRSLTCTPFYIAKPKPNSHLAWAESSAVVYANSVIGAWTNREGGPSALAAAIIGKTPNYGVHKPENRQPNILVKVETNLKNESEYGALGICLGRILKDKIPAIQGLRRASETQLKQLTAAVATTGMANMLHLDTLVETKGIEKITIEVKDIRNTIEGLCTGSDSQPDLVFIGCPHCSLSEIKEIAQLAKGNKTKSGKEFWVCTSPCIRERAKEYVETIGKAGGHVLAGVCTVVSWTETLGIETIMTNSAKTAYYAPTLNKATVKLAPLKECMKTILRG